MRQRSKSGLPYVAMTFFWLSLCGCPKLHSAPPPNEVRVFFAAPEMTSLEAESQVAIPVERMLSSVAQLSRLRSRASNAGTEVRLSLAPRSAADGLAVLEKLRGASGAGLPLPTMQSLRGPIIYRYTVESSQLPGSELLALHERLIRRALATVPGVRAVTTCGSAPRRVEIIEDLPRMTALRIAAGDVEKAVREATLLDGRPIRIREGGGLTLPQLSRLRVAEREGAPVFLNDLAVVRLGAAPPTCLAARDGRANLLAAQVWLTSGMDPETAQKSIAARPTITPAHPVSSKARFASSAVFMSPFTTTGIETTSRALAAHVQSALPLWPICAVRQWIVRAATPASSRRRARSTIGMCDSGPRPIRVFTVTGRLTLEAMSRAISTIFSGSRSHPAPAPRPAILGTQQPQLMSMKRGFASSATRAASARRGGSAP